MSQFASVNQTDLETKDQQKRMVLQKCLDHRGYSVDKAVEIPFH